jgi:hypothetical protein
MSRSSRGFGEVEIAASVPPDGRILRRRGECSTVVASPWSGIQQRFLEAPDMVHMARWQRITGWCGIFFFLMMALAFFGFYTDLAGVDSPKEFVDQATDNDAVLRFSALGVPAMLVWLWFAAGVRERLSWGMGWSPLRAIGWASAIGAVVLVVTTLIAQGTLLSGGRNDLALSDEFLRNIFIAFNGMLFASFAFIGMWLFSSGLAAVSFGGMPKWWGWPAIVGGLLTIVASSVSSDIGYLAFAFWWAWSLVGGVWLAFADEPTLSDAGTVSKMDRSSAAA